MCILKTYNQKYCSSSCANITRVREWRLKQNNTCIDCGMAILPESQRCRGCSKSIKIRITKQSTLKEVHDKMSLIGKHPSWKNNQVRQLCRYWNRHLLLHPCQKCGYSLHVELCHIKSISSFKTTTQLGIINSKNNIAVLCRNCHWELDHGFIQKDQIPKRNNRLRLDSNQKPIFRRNR